ncbi:RNA polymerase sigma factor [Streptomyces sp. NPDC020883]|uniref:RNA polymerase sigma factor n=1 Tax=Streptomyces sp. NPDC020883 TaxID=3365099 RepID=UPI0037B07E24
MNGDSDVGALLRDLVPQVVGTLVRRHGRFEACEDAAQDALLDAIVQWRKDGVPDNPLGWLTTVAYRRLADRARSDIARRRREATVAAVVRADEPAESGPADFHAAGQDDSLILLFLCCHPSISPSSQLALTLRACGGLTTSQIARAFLVPEATMAQRISRAKQRIRTAGATFELPPPEDRPERLGVVLHVLYLIFNEGYTSTSGADLHQVELTREAIRLTRALRRALPDTPEVTGLLALMLLTDARRPARTDDDGDLVPLAEQDRTRWDGVALKEGIELTAEALARQPMGPYQLQAAIAAVHAEAGAADETDWPQIVILYRLLEQVSPNPMVTLNHAVAAAMAHGPRAGLDLLRPLAEDGRVADHHRLHAVRGHLLEMAGDRAAARESYREAARRTASLPERRFLESRADRLSDTAG